MALTVQDIITEVQVLLKDEGLRWPNDELIPGVNRAQKYCYKKRPDTCMDSVGRLNAPETVENLADELVIDERFEPAMVRFVTWWAFSKDTEYTDSAQLAVTHWAAFDELLTSQGA